VSYQPLVSIVTIVYNGEKHLEQTIQSVLNQTYPKIEYIIIDGGSTDKSPDIIKKYNKSLAYWISEKDNGVSNAFNKGIAKSTGEIIGLINADDWYEQTTVENVVNNIQNQHVVYGNLRYWKNEKRDMTVEGNHEYLTKEMTLNHPTVFIKSNCYKEFGGFNNEFKYAMDYELLVRLMANQCRFKHIPSVLANMRWEGISDKQWRNACLEVLDIKNKYWPDKKKENKIYYYKQLNAIKLNKFLHKIRFHKTIKFYRKYLSSIKKRYD
jgi:glycosyltransferase involved in cell wall biosynthesis